MQKQISSKQLAILVFIVACSSKLLMAPPLIMRSAGRDSYLTVAIYVVLEALSLFIILKTLHRNPDKTFFQILHDGMGKVFSRIIIGFFAAYALLKTLLTVSEFHLFFSNVVLDEFSWELMVIPLLAILFFGAGKTLKTLGRAGEILFPIVLLCILVITALLTRSMDFEKLLPFLEDGILPVLKGVEKYPLWFLDMPFLLIVLGNVKLSKHTKLLSLAAFGIAAFILIVMPLFLYATHANMTHLANYGHNASRMTQFGLGTQQFGRFDVILFCIWLFSTLLYVTLVFYILLHCVLTLFSVKKHPWAVRLGLIVAIYFISVFLFNTNDRVLMVGISALRYAIWPVLLLPPAAYVTAVVKYKPNKLDFIKNKNKRRRHETSAVKKENNAHPHL